MNILPTCSMDQDSSQKLEVFSVIALMELGLNSWRGRQTKYYIEKYRIHPMTEEKYSIDLGYAKIKCQGAIRFLMRAHHNDLLFFNEAITNFVQYYLADPQTKAAASTFLNHVVIPGFSSLSKVYENTTTAGQINLWIQQIQESLNHPPTEVKITEFGKKVKSLVSNEDLEKINLLFQRLFEVPDSDTSLRLKRIAHIDKKMNTLYEKYKKIRIGATEEIQMASAKI